MKYIFHLLFISISLLSYSCAGPRVMNQSGKVSPKGDLSGGVSLTGNIATEAIAYSGKLVIDNAKRVASKDSIFTDDNLLNLNKAAIAVAIDPPGFGYDLYLRYGLGYRTEIGIKRAGGANVIGAQFQFLGPVGTIHDKTDGRMYGSIGLQYGWRKYELPKYFGELQQRLGFSFKRKDILVPLTFSLSLGNEETYGSIAFGAVYSYTKLDFTSLPDRVFTMDGKLASPVANKQGYSAFGLFVNVKAGYKWVYLIPSIAMYYQNYGEYPLFNGDKAAFSGLTFVPALSLQLRGNVIKKAPGKN